MTTEKPKQTPADDSGLDYQGYVINERGEEVPITEDMMAESMRKIKLKSIGAHTGYTKAITPDMVAERAEE